MARACGCSTGPIPPAARSKGRLLQPGWESFVGAGPMVMRHGLTMGEMGHWFVRHFNLDVDYRVIAMEGYDPDAAPGFGWPADRLWINPSPNAAQPQHGPRLCRDGDAGGHDAERGQGHDPPAGAVRRARYRRPRHRGGDGADRARSGSPAARMREVHFEPTFHKHAGKLCSGLHIHAEGDAYDHAGVQAVALQALAFKAIRTLQPDYDLWRDFPYEYVFDKLAIDVINGGPALREWVDDPNAEAGRPRRDCGHRTSGPGPTKSPTCCFIDRCGASIPASCGSTKGASPSPCGETS